MNKCDNCKMTQRCDELERMGKVPKIGKNCRCYTPVKPQTNYNRIVSKTPEELAKFMGELPCCPPGAEVKELCYPMDSCEGTDLQVQCWLDWLKEEVKEGET